MTDATAPVETPRFVQVDADRAYLVRVVPVGPYTMAVREKARDVLAVRGYPLSVQGEPILALVREGLAALAVERVWLVRCPECKGEAALDGHPEEIQCCCEGSPKRGWVVEACPDERCHTDKEWALGCTGCHGTGQHVERMGLVEALGSKTFARFAGRLEADGDFVSSELHPAYHRGRTPDRLTVDDFRWLADALALLTEGPNKKLKIGK